MLDVSVIICSHNPRTDYLHRVLLALRDQSLPLSRWELLLIDNASNEPLEDAWDISWHPRGRQIHEEEVGLSYARRTGVRRSIGQLLIFVDDDNVLQSDYLEEACRIAQEFPQIGAFGGSISGEFDTPVPHWAGPYLEGLCIKEITRDRWGNDYCWSEAVPYGAGICVRRVVAESYCAAIEMGTLRKKLGRTGRRLTSAEDVDIAWTAIDLSLGTGRFHKLKLIHLIPATRLTEDYLVRLYAGFTYSNTILWAQRGLARQSPYEGWRERLRHLVACVRLHGIRRHMYFACREAAKEAWRSLEADANLSSQALRLS